MKEDGLKQENPKAKKTRTKLNYDSATSSNGEQKHQETSFADVGKDELFSPALKPPLTLRSTSASPVNAQERFETKPESDEPMKEDVSRDEELFNASGQMVYGEGQEEECVTPPEHEFNPYVALNEI